MVRTRKHTTVANTCVAGHCFICKTAETSEGSVCATCITRLKTICSSKSNETDKVIADAIRIGRAVGRRTLVRQAAKRLCLDYKKLNMTCQGLKKTNRVLKEQNRQLKRNQGAKKRNGFKDKSKN